MTRLSAWIVTVVAAGLVAVTAPAAAAATAQETLTLDDVGEGDCSPDPVAPSTGTDCSFELARRAPLDPDGGPYTLVVAGTVGDDLPHCSVDGSRLRCPDVRVGTRAPESDPTRSATLVFGDRRRADAVGFEIADVDRRARLRIADHAVVTPGVPLRYATPQDLPDGTWLQVTRRYGTEPVASLAVESTGGWDSQPAEVPADRLGLDAGSHRLRLCLGPTAADCRLTGWSTTLQVIEEPLQPLVEGHNTASADRINLVVAGHGFSEDRAFADVATMALDPDNGLVLVDEDGTRLTEDEARQAAGSGRRVDVHYGFFSIEPFADQTDRFNVWLLPDQLDHPDALLHIGPGDSPPWIDGFTADGNELTDVSVVTIAQDPPGAEPESEAARNALHDVEGPIDRDDEDFGFSGSTTWVDATTPWRDVTTVAHELGHALFGLRDEYRDSESAVPKYGYPNCAQSRGQAEQWWGDMIGMLDPMAERYRQVEETYQPDLRDISDDQLARWVGVDIHEHPCGSAEDAPASFIPTQRGLMGNELPILGSVNRARAEQVLQLFSGQSDSSEPTRPSASPSPAPSPSPSATDEPDRTPTDDDLTPDPTTPPTDEPTEPPTDETGNGGSWPTLLLITIGLGIVLVGGVLWARR